MPPNLFKARRMVTYSFYETTLDQHNSTPPPPKLALPPSTNNRRLPPICHTKSTPRVARRLSIRTSNIADSFHQTTNLQYAPAQRNHDETPLPIKSTGRSNHCYNTTRQGHATASGQQSTTKLGFHEVIQHSSNSTTQTTTRKSLLSSALERKAMT